tara:strand:- start:565 stop:771 length:207 start_codon:yes stop_codon:yes gene_type:complete
MHGLLPRVGGVNVFMDANKEGRALDRWIEYRTFGGSISKAKDFLRFSEENQKLLVKVARGKALLRRSL